MLDSVMGFYAAHRFKGRDATYVPSMAVVSSKLIHENADTLTVLLPPWRGGASVYMKLAKRLEKQGSAALIYEFHRQILEPDVQKTRASFVAIQRQVAKDIRELVKKHGYKRVDFVAASLGSVSMCMLAASYPDFTGATFVASGSNLARCLWEGSRTRDLRQAFESVGVTEQKLDEEWRELAPLHWVSAFKGKKVRFILSTADKIVPTKYQRELLEAVRPYAAVCETSEVKTGHLATIHSYCIRGSLHQL